MTKQFIDFKPAVAENRWDLIKVLFTLRWRKKAVGEYLFRFDFKIA